MLFKSSCALFRKKALGLSVPARGFFRGLSRSFPGLPGHFGDAARLHRVRPSGLRLRRVRGGRSRHRLCCRGLSLNLMQS